MTKPRLFISHSHKDDDWCNPFVDALQQGGVDVWYDRTGLYVGASWIGKIEDEIEQRELFLIVVSPNALESTWVRQEFLLAVAARKEILGVIHQPVSLKGFLRIYQMLNVENQTPQKSAQDVLAVLREHLARAGTNQSTADSMISVKSASDVTPDPKPAHPKQSSTPTDISTPAAGVTVVIVDSNAESDAISRVIRRICADMGYVEGNPNNSPDTFQLIQFSSPEKAKAGISALASAHTRMLIVHEWTFLNSDLKIDADYFISYLNNNLAPGFRPTLVVWSSRTYEDFARRFRKLRAYWANNSLPGMYLWKWELMVPDTYHKLEQLIGNL